MLHALTRTVARQISEDATAENAEKRWINTVNPARPVGPWTAEEDEQMQRAMAVFDQQWAQIAPFVNGRTAGQCRDHFEDGLKPTLKKDSWTTEELDQLRALVDELGNKWIEISKRLEGRSDAQVIHHGPPAFFSRVDHHFSVVGPGEDFSRVRYPGQAGRRLSHL